MVPYLSEQILKEGQVLKEKSISSVLDILSFSHLCPIQKKERLGLQLRKEALIWNANLKFISL